MEGGLESGFHSSTGSILDSYRVQSGHDNQQHTSMRRPRSHAAHRAKTNPFTKSTEQDDLLQILPSLEPQGLILPWAIKGDHVVSGHNFM
eukprot:8726148-Karenia_brevis.AAC.1